MGKVFLNHAAKPSHSLVSVTQAQFRASLRGTVKLTDSQGAVIPGATVTLVNTDTNNTQGAFLFVLRAIALWTKVSIVSM